VRCYRKLLGGVAFASSLLWMVAIVARLLVVVDDERKNRTALGKEAYTTRKPIANHQCRSTA